MKLSKVRYQTRLENALNALHEAWGSVPIFCNHCDAIVDGDMELCEECMEPLTDEDDWSYDANGSPVSE